MASKNPNAFYPTNRSYDDFYTGAMDPKKPYIWEPGALPGGVQPGLKTNVVRTIPIDPYTSQPKTNSQFLARPGVVAPNNMPRTKPPTSSQMASIRDVSTIPSWRYQQTADTDQTRLPAGWPWQSGSETAVAAIDRAVPRGGSNPQTLLAMMGGSQAGAPAPSFNRFEQAYLDGNPQFPPVGANPGTGGALIGGGQMPSGIPPQQPPADGSSPLPTWADDNPKSAVEQALLARSGPTGTAGAYQLQNGQKVGYAPQTVNGLTYTPSTPGAAYDLANAAGKINALNKQVGSTGQTGVYNYDHGVKTSTVNGQSSADAYATAVKKNNSKSGSTSSGKSKTTSSGESWASAFGGG